MFLAVLVTEPGGRHGVLATTALHQLLSLVGNIHVPLSTSVARGEGEVTSILWLSVFEGYLKLSLSWTS